MSEITKVLSDGIELAEIDDLAQLDSLIAALKKRRRAVKEGPSWRDSADSVAERYAKLISDDFLKTIKGTNPWDSKSIRTARYVTHALSAALLDTIPEALRAKDKEERAKMAAQRKAAREAREKKAAVKK